MTKYSEDAIVNAVTDEVMFKRRRVYDDHIDFSDCPFYTSSPTMADKLVAELRSRGCKVNIGQTDSKRWYCEVFGGGLVAAMPICKTREEAIAWAVCGAHGVYWMITQNRKRFGSE